MGKRGNGNLVLFYLKKYWYKVTVFQRHKDKLYMIEESPIDFKDCPVDAPYLICVNLNGKQKPALKACRTPIIN